MRVVSCAQASIKELFGAEAETVAPPDSQTEAAPEPEPEAEAEAEAGLEAALAACEDAADAAAARRARAEARDDLAEFDESRPLEEEPAPAAAPAPAPDPLAADLAALMNQVSRTLYYYLLFIVSLVGFNSGLELELRFETHFGDSQQRWNNEFRSHLETGDRIWKAVRPIKFLMFGFCVILL